MPDARFPILGTAVPPMLGRGSIFQRMEGALTKRTPDHLQVVGPRFSGKTVILNAFATKLQQASNPYTAVVLWDLGHQTPATDEIFMKDLACELSSALSKNHSDYAKHLKETKDSHYQDIGEVLELLNEEEKKVLVIMDGFDKPLSNGQLTRNLWDQLRELAHKSSLRLVTASRRTLRDLIRDPESQTSDFWNIFDPTPVRVGCFDENDFAAVLETMPEWQLTTGAQTELWNASNGFPVLSLGVLNAVSEMEANGTVQSSAVLNACETAFPALQAHLDALWRDCPQTSQDLFRRVREEGTLPRAGIAAADAEILVERGFVQTAANKLQRPSRLLKKYLENQPHEGNAILRLFTTTENYLKNFKEVLERRLGQIDDIDATLKRYIERATEDLPDHPDVFLANVRGIVNQAFMLIWKAELPEKSVPHQWIAQWEYNNERGIDEWKTTFPQGGRRLRLLDLMTGTEKSPPRSLYVSKATYVLMNAANAFGDFGQHQEGETIDSGTAYSTLNLCIELAASLTRELPRKA